MPLPPAPVIVLPEIVAFVGDGDALNHAALRARFGSGVTARDR